MTADSGPAEPVSSLVGAQRRSSLGLSSWGRSRFVLSLRRSLYHKSVAAVHQAIQDGIGQRRVAEPLVPAIDGQLAGHYGRSTVVAVFQHFQHVAALRLGQSAQAPVIQD